MQRTFVTYLLYQHSQYTAFYRPNKTEVMIITPGKSVTMGDLKISKTDVKRAVAGQRLKENEENKHSAVISGCGAKGETLYCD